MEEALRALLTSYAPLTALVSTRIFWNAIPQDTPDPCVVLYKITGSPTYTFTDGATDLTSSIVQIDVRALTVASMWAIARAIEAKLSGYRGGAFQAVFKASDRQSSEKPGTVLYHRCSIDFDVHYAA